MGPPIAFRAKGVEAVPTIYRGAGFADDHDVMRLKRVE